MSEATYRHVLVARRLPAHDCWADDGEWLVPAAEDAIPAFRLPPGAHFFRGLVSGRGARYGIVAEATEPVDPEQLVRAMGAAADRGRAEVFLRILTKQRPGTVMAVSWRRTYGTPVLRRRHLAVHRAALGREALDPRRAL